MISNVLSKKSLCPDTAWHNDTNPTQPKNRIKKIKKSKTGYQTDKVCSGILFKLFSTNYLAYNFRTKQQSYGIVYLIVFYIFITNIS